MSGSRGFSNAVGGVGRNTLDVPVAVLAALAVAFLAFAVPPELLSQLVGSTGLPQLLPAAEPPLGNKARVGLGLGGAIAVFVLVFGLLRALDRKSNAQDDEAVDTPRLRRRDLHPDAPARRPISATSEFGEPEPIAAESEATPAWLAPAELPADVDQYEVPAIAGVESDSRPDRDPEPAAPPTEIAAPIERAVAQTSSEAAAEPPFALSSRPQSIPELMARLEQGLARRQPTAETPLPAPTAPLPDHAPTAEAGDDRLQSAIDSLQRLASRQG